MLTLISNNLSLIGTGVAASLATVAAKPTWNALWSVLTGLGNKIATTVQRIDHAALGGLETRLVSLEADVKNVIDLPQRVVVLEAAVANTVTRAV